MIISHANGGGPGAIWVGASTNMHNDILRSPLDRSRDSRSLSQSFTLTFLDQHTCFDASRREKRDSVRIIALALFVRKLFTKKTIWLFEVVGLTC